MSFITNIRSVAKYESKILNRSWFFRIFAILCILILSAFNLGITIGDGYITWFLTSIPSNLPYFNLLMLNTGQAVVAIFLASDFLKRDKKLDTSEVFYVHPLSNAEYVFGKIWGNLRAFIFLNLIVVGICLIFNSFVPGGSIDFSAYLLYFLLICVPTLVFIIGLSIFLMLILKNQALTFIILLGYIGLTIFYIGDKFYYLFDYMAYSLPMMKSSIVGFTNYEALINHRAIYLFAGFGFICFTIALFNRLPNSRRSMFPWMILAVGSLVISLGCGYNHVNGILQQGRLRTLYTEINNKYGEKAKMAVDTFTLSVQQKPGTIGAEVTMEGTALATSNEFAFCLNPGFDVIAVTARNEEVTFVRDHQILLVDFGKTINRNDSIALTVRYSGTIDENFCYLDIPEDVLQEKNTTLMMNVDKKYALQTSNYLLFTPEIYWYPRPGIAYSDKCPDWQQFYFSTYKIDIKPLPGLTAISQGQPRETDEGHFAFQTDNPVQSISLIIGNYQTTSVMADSVQFSIRYLEGNDYFKAGFDSIADTIPSLVAAVKEQFERNYRLKYPFKRFSVVEVPAQFHSYSRTWSQAQETMQPEMVLFPEKAWKFPEMDVVQMQKNQMRWAEWQGRAITPNEAKIRTINQFFYFFFQSEINHSFQSGSRGRMEVTSQASPYFFFPQVYNFRYNIFSPRWPVSNRMVELYLQNKSDNSGWERQMNGISNNEKASRLFKIYSFKELQTDVRYRNLLDNIIALRGSQLFALPEISVGVTAFRDSVYAFLARNEFRNIHFEAMLDTIERMSDTRIKPEVEKWNHPSPALPYYTIGNPEVVHINHRGVEKYVLKFRISNDSHTEGVVNLRIHAQNAWGPEFDKKTNRNVHLDPHQTKEFVSVWEGAVQSVNVNTLISDNLPCWVHMPVRDIRKEAGAAIEAEGDFILPALSGISDNEVIVDNEDPLFTVSEPTITGYLPQWLDKMEDTSFKYAGIMWWRPPLEWTATTNGGYHGRYVRSACVIKSGDGSKTATWKVPVPRPGHYELHYWAYSEELNQHRNARGEYHFKVQYNGEEEDAYLSVRQGQEWERLGVYYLDTDTIRVVLTNESKLSTVTADAVKLLRR